MSLEKWASIASVGLFAMFVGEMISIYYFMTDIPANFEFASVFEPTPKILQFISIGIAPASILAAFSFILSKRYGSKQIGSIILSGGIILLILNLLRPTVSICNCIPFISTSSHLVIFAIVPIDFGALQPLIDLFESIRQTPNCPSPNMQSSTNCLYLGSKILRGNS